MTNKGHLDDVALADIARSYGGSVDRGVGLVEQEGSEAEVVSERALVGQLLEREGLGGLVEKLPGWFGREELGLLVEFVGYLNHVGLVDIVRSFGVEVHRSGCLIDGGCVFVQGESEEAGAWSDGEVPEWFGEEEVDLVGALIGHLKERDKREGWRSRPGWT